MPFIHAGALSGPARRLSLAYLLCELLANAFVGISHSPFSTSTAAAATASLSFTSSF